MDANQAEADAEAALREAHEALEEAKELLHSCRLRQRAAPPSSYVLANEEAACLQAVEHSESILTRAFHSHVAVLTLLLMALENELCGKEGSGFA